MLYSEFIENVKCKDTKYNYTVYKNLEALYMVNDTITKETIYKTGKMLVDNSETETEKATREKIENEINLYKVWIADTQKTIDTIKELIARDREYINAGIGGDTERANIKYWVLEVNRYKKDIQSYRDKIRVLKMLFAQ